MFRRAFWFVCGAVSGILGLAWVKRRAREITGSLTPGSVLGLVRNLLTIAYHRALVAVAYLDGFVRGGAPEHDPVARSSRVDAVPRRHIATARRNSHR
jgi:hypothetical protein